MATCWERCVSPHVGWTKPLTGGTPPWEDARIYALIAAISCFLPTMFMMRVRL
jgi:hypothetical protein